MKLVFAHDHRFVRAEGKFHSRGGLPQTVLARYAEGFDCVQVICRVEDRSEIELPPIEREDIHFHPQENISSLSGLRNFRRVKIRIAALVSESDAVVARLPSLLGVMAASEARRQGVPCLIEVVGNALEAAKLHGSSLGQIFGPIMHLLTKREVYYAGIAVYITQQYLQAVYPTQGKQFVCPNVRVSRLPEEGLWARQQIHPRSTAPRIGLIGSLDVNYKGHDVAIEALHHLSIRHGLADATLEFAGGGAVTRWKPLAAAQGVSDRVRFHGSIPSGSAMMAWIDDLDLLLQPSLTEGQGRAIIEGMSRGCPVVATDVGGIPELLESDWLASPRDAAALAERCACLLNSPEQYGGVAARNWAKTSEFDSMRIEEVRKEAFAVLRAAVEQRRCIGSGEK